MTPDEAKETIGEFIGNAKQVKLRDFERALYKIIRLRWWELWKARDIADEALGTGKYWNKGFKK